MTIKRLVILQLMLFAGLGSAYLIPSPAKPEPMGVIMDLPESIGQWTGVPGKVTDRELNELAADTSFSRKVYSNAFGDQILVSIVLAGDDPDNSIHRPERCLPSQGWTILDSKTIAITAPESTGGVIKTTRLHNVQSFQDDKGNQHKVFNLNYYWFVGYNHLTESSVERAFLDIRDRITKGVNQRWAYVTVASTVTEGLTRFGRSEAETDRMIQSLIAQIYPKIVRTSPAGGK